jgi:hypothetical protein
MVGVRLPKDQAEQIRRLAQGKQTPSLIIRQFISDGLNRLKEERMQEP